MRFLFVTGGSQGTVFSLTPLANALRNAGHEVFMAADDSLISVINGNGIPAVSITPIPIHHYMWTDASGGPAAMPETPRDTMLLAGRAFARMADACLEALRDLVGVWRPDLVVGGATSYAAGLIAAEFGLPYVRHAWDLVPTVDMDDAATEILAPQLRKLGLDELPRPATWVDVHPAVLRGENAPSAELMRFIPGNEQRRLERWMYARAGDRRRVLLTTGTRGGASRAQNAAHLRGLNDALAELDLEVLIAAPDDIAESLRADVGATPACWIPLDVVAPTCDVIVHHGGGVTATTAMNAGVPQLVAPRDDYQVALAAPIADFGAAILLERGHDSAEHIAVACREILADPGYRLRSRLLAEQMAALPAPSAVAGVLERLVGG